MDELPQPFVVVLGDEGVPKCCRFIFIHRWHTGIPLPVLRPHVDELDNIAMMLLMLLAHV